MKAIENDICKIYGVCGINSRADKEIINCQTAAVWTKSMSKICSHCQNILSCFPFNERVLLFWEEIHQIITISSHVSMNRIGCSSSSLMFKNELAHSTGSSRWKPNFTLFNNTNVLKLYQVSWTTRELNNFQEILALNRNICKHKYEKEKPQ